MSIGQQIDNPVGCPVTHYEQINVAFRARTPMDWVDKLRADYAPVAGVHSKLDAEGKRGLRTALLALAGKFNRAKDSSMLVDAEYLEVVVQRR